MSGVALTVTLSAFGALTEIAQIWQTAGGIERPGCRLAVNPAFPSAPIGVGSPPTSGYGAAPDDPSRPLRYQARVTAEVISSLRLRLNKIRFVCLSLRLRVFKSPLPAQTDRARRMFWDRETSARNGATRLPQKVANFPRHLSQRHGPAPGQPGFGVGAKPATGPRICYGTKSPRYGPISLTTCFCLVGAYIAGIWQRCIRRTVQREMQYESFQQLHRPLSPGRR
jgi:hypothetical protein